MTGPEEVGVRTSVFDVDPARPEEARLALDAAAGALASGGLVVIPTETVYGIAGRPDLPEATARLFAAKGRPRTLSLPVLAPSASAAWEVAIPSPGAEALGAAFWPGPLTIVRPRTAASRPWRLGERDDTVAVRVPDHPLTLALLEATGPLAATSANRSGTAPLSDPDAIVATFGRSAAVILLLRPGVPAPAGLASTVVDLTGPDLRILRAGGIDEWRVRAALGESTRGAE